MTNVDDVSRIAAMRWYDGSNGYVEPNCPALAICFDNGRCQISRDESDESKLALVSRTRTSKASMQHAASQKKSYMYMYQ